MYVALKAFEDQWGAMCPGGVIDRTLLRKAVASGRLPDRDLYPLHIPLSLSSVVKKCLREVEGDRFQSVLEVINALLKIDGPEFDWA